MRQSVRWAPALVILLLFTGTALGAAKDVPGSKDHPLLSRMTNFYITSYEVSDFDSHEFADSKGDDVTVEGRKYVIQYEIKEGAKVPSDLQITRNYVNAIKQLGGTAYEYGKNRVSLQVTKDGREVWAEVWTSGGELYTLTIVEKAGLKQEVTAGDLLKALNEQGRVALYIHFDTGKATIKPESQPVINEIVALLKDNPDLKVSIEGHTDNVGDAKLNKTLSEQRAAAVLAAIVAQGVDARRLKSAGFGKDKPIADNKTEEGRAKNRRVELVKL